MRFSDFVGVNGDECCPYADRGMAPCKKGTPTLKSNTTLSLWIERDILPNMSTTERLPCAANIFLPELAGFLQSFRAGAGH
jgi:hypothetical protein